MSTAHLVNACAACGAEESLDALLERMVDDEFTRELIADVIAASLPVGALVLRYLRLHKPPKHKLRIERVAAVLSELAPDIRRGAINRCGRDWQVPPGAWRAGFEAVFDAVDKGTLRAPLTANVYLYEVLMRAAEKAEGAAERGVLAEHRGGVRAEPVSVTRLLVPNTAGPGFTPPAGPSLYARRLQAENEARRKAQEGTPADAPQSPEAKDDNP